MIPQVLRLLVFGAALISVFAGEAFAQFTISGTVRDPINSPVADVDVFLYTEQGDPIGGVDPGRTDIAGFYTLGAGGQIPSGTYNVGFEPPSNSGLLPEMVNGVVVNGNEILDVNLQSGSHLTGFVRDTTGTGIPDIDLNAYYEPNFDPIELTGDNTGPNGEYDVLLPTGLLRIVYRPVQGENFVPVELRNVNITGDTAINVVLRAGFLLSGTVTGPGGTPVVNGDIDVEDSFTGVKLYTPGDNTDVNGHYQVRVPGGTFNISVAALVTEHLVPEIINNVVINGNATVNFALEAGYIVSGAVRNSLANPVPDADIDVRIPVTGERLFTPSDNTDQSGFYQVVIPAGTYDFDFKPPVVPPYLAPLRQRNIVVSADRTLDATVPNGFLVSGQVNSFRGVGVSGVNIDAKDSINLDVPLVGDNTAPNGSFSMVMATGLYDIEIEPSQFTGLAPELLDNVRIREDTSITAVLDTGMVVSGTVRDSAGAYFPNVAVIARKSSNGAERFTPGNRSDLNGLYRISIPPDMYDLVYRPDPASGVTDTVMLNDVSVTTNLVIDIEFPSQSGDSIPPSIEVLSPNGGEDMQAYELIQITWNASDNVGVSAIDLYYSITGPAGPFTPIAIGEANDGAYTWEVPPEPTTDGRIRIVARDASFNSAEDLSDGSFAIIYSATCCGGFKGDVNGNGQTNGIDVVYFVGYLKGGSAPPDTCDCGVRGRILATSDANGNCQANGIDVTYMVSFFKGGPGLLCCPDCPPMLLLNGKGRKLLE